MQLRSTVGTRATRVWLQIQREAGTEISNSAASMNSVDFGWIMALLVHAKLKPKLARVSAVGRRARLACDWPQSVVSAHHSNSLNVFCRQRRHTTSFR